MAKLAIIVIMMVVLLYHQAKCNPAPCFPGPPGTEEGSACSSDCFRFHSDAGGDCVKSVYKDMTTLVTRCLNGKITGEWKSDKQQEFCTTKLIC